MKTENDERHDKTRTEPAANDAERAEAAKYGVEPTNPDDVVLGAEIGGVGGAVTGAIAGSALGLAGAVTGAVIGGVLGAAGSAAAVAAVDKVDDDYTRKDLEVGPLDYEAAAKEHDQVELPRPEETDEHVDSVSRTLEHPHIPRRKDLKEPRETPVQVQPTDGSASVDYPDIETTEALRQIRRRE
jgi:hypothetical protein